MIICALRQQILDCPGHAMVLGGPGSGKTTIALKKAVRRIGQGLSPGESVLFLSFSRSAVSRIMQASKTEMHRDERALLNVQTFHSFFWDLLNANAYLLGAKRKLQILMPQDERVLSGNIRKEKKPADWQAWLQERERLFVDEGRIAFDLFAPKAALLLEKSLLLRQLVARKHPLVIVDEAQDTNPEAWRCIQQLSPFTQVICLADLEQQIFDHLPGIGPERIAAITIALSPLQVDLGSQNMRSPGSEIAIFGQDLLRGLTRPNGYRGVTSIDVHHTTDLSSALRQALGLLQREIKNVTGDWARSVAILVPYAGEAAAVSRALNSGDKPVSHKLLFDEAQALLAARFAAFLLEPKETMAENLQLGEALRLLADMRKAGGANADATRLVGWSAKFLSGKSSNAGTIQVLRGVLAKLITSTLSGDPAKDWSMVKRVLRESKNAMFLGVAQHLDYLVAFNRGKRISAGLGASWTSFGEYRQARITLDAALAQDLILDGTDDPEGIQVMTIHKAKGKQFDGVLIFRRGKHNGTAVVSSLIWRDDPPPHRKSRKVLMVAVTRARFHTMFLQHAWPSCPIMYQHALRSPFTPQQ